MGALPKRLAIGGIHYITAVVAGSSVIACREIRRILTCLVLHLEEMHFVVRGILLMAVTTTALEAQRDVATSCIQSAIEL